MRYRHGSAALKALHFLATSIQVSEILFGVGSVILTWRYLSHLKILWCLSEVVVVQQHFKLGRKMPIFRSVTADFIIFIYCTAILLHVTAAAATDFKLQPRKNVDHNLDCRGRSLPPESDWPDLGPYRSSFQNLEQLCGRVAGRPTVGCICDTPYTRVECPNTGAISLVTNQVLWNKFHDYCQDRCECAQDRLSRTFEEALREETAAARDAESRRRFGRVVTAQARSEPSDRSGSGSVDVTQEGICGGRCSAITR